MTFLPLSQTQNTSHLYDASPLPPAFKARQLAFHMMRSTDPDKPPKLPEDTDVLYIAHEQVLPWFQVSNKQ